MSGLNLLNTSRNSAAFSPGYAPTDMGDVIGTSFQNVRQNFTTDAEIRLIGDPLNERNALLKDRTGQDITALTGVDKKYTNPSADGRISMMEEANNAVDDIIVRGRKEQPGIYDGIKTSAEIREEGKTKAQEAMRGAEETASRNPNAISRITGQLVGGIGGAFTDPLNIATLPIGAGEAKIVGAGAFATAKGIALAAAKEGALQAAVEAASIPQISHWQTELGHKYGLAEGATDIAFGFLGGAGIRAGLEGVMPALRGIRKGVDHTSAYVLDQIATRAPAVSQTVRDSMKYMSRAAYIDDAAPVPLRDAGELQAHRAAVEKVDDDISNYRRPAVEVPGVTKIVTPRNELELEVIPRVVDLADLVTSDRAEFDQGLQPRDRSNRVASDVRIAEIAARLDPGQLGDSRVSNTGSPIVGPDMMVESGNGRVMALRQAYEKHPDRAQAYRDFLEGQGYKTAGMKQPVLIRQRVSELTPAQRKDFVIFSNEDVADRLSTTERAMADAKLLGDRVVDQFRGGDIDNAVNASFVRDYIDTAVSPAERNAFLTPGGKLSQDGIRRIRAGLLAKAYNDADLVQKLLEDTDNNIKTIGNVLMDTAGEWSKLRAAVARGDTPPQFDITADLMDAVKTIINARAQNRPITDFINQRGLFAETELTAETTAFIRGMYNEKLTRPLGYDKTKYFTDFYLREANKVQGGPDLLGGKQVEPMEILSKGLERLHGKEATAEFNFDLAGSPELAAIRAAGLQDLARAVRHPANGMTLMEAIEEMARRPETGKAKGAKGKERKALHQRIVDDLYKEQQAKNGGSFEAGKTFEIVLGPPGAGKSSKIVNAAMQDLKAVVIDSDMVKEKMPEFDGGIGANAVHEESKAITREWLDHAIANDFNIIHPIVGANAEKVADLVDELVAIGYSVNIRLVHIPAEESLKRVINRFGEEGRLVPPSYVMSIGDGPIRTFDALKERGDINAYSYFDNNVKIGEPAFIVESNDPRYAASQGTRPGLQRAGEAGSETQGSAGSQPEVNPASADAFFDANAYRLREYREAPIAPPSEINPSDRLAASRASFDDMVKETPDMMVTMDDGSTVRLADYAEATLKADERLLEALTTCRLA